jgi:AcrR family transcriptional regulator
MAAASTAQRIASTARRLLDRHGVKAVTMRRVARAVGVTPMAVYRHFPSRANLLDALADQGFDELAALLAGKRFSGEVELQLLKLVEIYLDHALENPRLFELMFLESRAGARRYPSDFKAGESPTANLLAQVVRQGMETRYFLEDDVWEIVFAMGALSHGLIMLFLGGRMEMPTARFRIFYRQSFRRFLHGICS